MQSLKPEQFLREEFERRLKKNSQYSLRSFANLLKLSPGELSEILRNKRKLSLKSALKISKHLDLSQIESKQFLGLFLSEREPPVPSRVLSEDQFRVVADWYCFAILSLYEVKGFRFDSYWIAKQLGITASEARAAVERMTRIGMIVTENGKRRVAHDYFMSVDEIPSEAVQHCHSDLLDKAKAALKIEKLEEREMGGVTFAVHPSLLPELKQELKQFLDHFAKKTARKTRFLKTDVYHLETALFRLNKPGSRP